MLFEDHDNNGWLDMSIAYLQEIQDSNDLNQESRFTGVYQLPFAGGSTCSAIRTGWWTLSSVAGRLGALYLYESADPGQPQCGRVHNGQHNGLGGTTGCFETPYGINPIQDPEAHCGGYSFFHPWRHAIRGGSQSDYWRDHVPAGATAYGCAQANIVYKRSMLPCRNIVSMGIRLGAHRSSTQTSARHFLSSRL